SAGRTRRATRRLADRRRIGPLLTPSLTATNFVASIRRLVAFERAPDRLGRGRKGVMAIAKAEKASTDAVGSGDVIEELRRRYDRLTQSQKRIAEYIIAHSHTVAFSTVDQMAAQLDVNPSTIVRFTYRLGLDGFPDLQERMRELLRGQLARTGDPINEGQVAAHLEGTSFGASLSHDWQNLHHTISNV